MHRNKKPASKLHLTTATVKVLVDTQLANIGGAMPPRTDSCDLQCRTTTSDRC